MCYKTKLIDSSSGGAIIFSIKIFSIMIFSIITFNIMIFSIMIFSIMTFSIMTFRIDILSKMAFGITKRKCNDT